MTVIPVIDLLAGQVVRAVRGDRRRYRPIVSPLCGRSDPPGVAACLAAHTGSARLYVADLDALMGGVPQLDVIRALLEQDPARELWLDAGVADAAAARALFDALGPLAARLVPVFGSESLRSREALAGCLEAAGRDRAVLSLDRRDGARLDPAGCWDAPELWPARVIVMTLERVGADSGPDLDTLAEVRRRAPQAFLVGAGGIRHAADLAAAEAAGAGAWLVASALHDGRLPPAHRDKHAPG